MNIEKDQPRLKPIEPVENSIKCTLLKSFLDRQKPVIGNIPSTAKTNEIEDLKRQNVRKFIDNNVLFLNEIEESIASRSQLLQMLDKTDEFYEIINAQLEFSKQYYVEHFKQVNR